MVLYLYFIEKVIITKPDSNRYLFNDLPWQLLYYICILFEKMINSV